jgi:preprotein translocase subunit SecF
MTMRFRELIQPGTNFEFVGKTRMWLTISLFAVLFSIAMLPINHFIRGSALNYSIDFKGGTDIIMTFGKPVSSGDVRAAMEASGHKNVDVSTFQFKDANGVATDAFMVRVAEFGALEKEKSDAIADELVKKLGGAAVVSKATWSGDTLYLRSTKALAQEDLKTFLASKSIEMKPWSPDQLKTYSTAVVGTTEFNAQVAVYGLDRSVQTALTQKLGTEVKIRQVDAVGAKAGEELRNDGIKSLLYAIALIMLYIAFRFDFRYGPGTVASLLHDAILVIGVFAVTYVEFSLTTVAAVLTVIGYSMNDTVVVFDRIRENEHKLKDKKFDRVINISVNETLSRTVLTSLATFLTTLAMNLLGTGLVKNFAFAMNIGIIVGTYSTIFVAAPVLLWLHENYWSKRPATTSRRGRPAHQDEEAESEA